MKKKILFVSLILSLPLLASAAVSIPNPLGEGITIPILLARVIKGLLGVTGAFALFFVVQGGFIWMTSRGNAEKVKAGRESMVWAILGILAIFMSYVIINMVFASLGGV